MLLTIARATALAFALLATRGCIGPDGQQLGGEDGSDESPWTECFDEVMAEGRNGDYCTFEEGSGCGQQDEPRQGSPWTGNLCVGGRLIRTRSERIADAVPADRCLEPEGAEAGPFTHDVRAGTNGCIDVARCPSPGPGGLFEVCPDPPVEGVRESAIDVTPWTSCAAALQEGTDRDPCVGDFVCAANRELSPSRGTGTLAALCDQGVLRLYTLVFVEQTW